MEAADERAVGVGAERVLELVAVAPRLRGGDDRLEHEAVEAADPPQRVLDLLLLDLELALVAQHLPGRARMHRRAAATRSGPGSIRSLARACA